MSCEAHAKRAAYMREWNAKNKEKVNAQRKARKDSLSDAERERRLALGRDRNQRWYDANTDHARELSKKNAANYRQRYPERVRESIRAYGERNPEKVRKWARDSYHRVAADPERYARSLEARRLWKQQDRRKRGVPVKPGYTPEQQREARRRNGLAWYHRNIEKAQAYYVANKERIDAHNKAWRQLNRSQVSASRQNRRARELAAPGHCTREAWESRLAYYGERCWMCLGDWSEVDHVIPLSKGGSNWPSNLRPACRSCNARKHTKHYSSLPR